MLAYSLESAIVEKSEAMIRFSCANSGSKDSFDICALSSYHDLDGRILQEDITETAGT
ncbi:MAG: nucleotidyl transferase AbiEii/AbiGii toxin family protein [Bacillota bacterium]